jgi:hypothetical protein
MNPRLDKTRIKESLRPSTVLRSHGIRFTRRAGQVIFRICPVCGERSRTDAVAASEETGAWFCHVHGCRGDIFALVAGLGGLDLRAGFTKVLEEAAAIAGVDAVVNTTRALRPRAKTSRPPPFHDDTERNAASNAIAARLWWALAAESAAGSAYLRQRGLDREVLGDTVRFSKPGWPSVPLYSFDGELVNVLTRRFPSAEPVSRRVRPELDWPHVIRHNNAPKVRGLAGCTTKGTLVGRLRDAKSRDIVIAEGVFDSLTAIQAWPDAAVLGASGASNLPEIARRAGPILRANGKNCRIVMDADDPGERAAAEAIAILRNDRVPSSQIEIVDIGSAHDLNSALLDGWSP